MLPKAEPLQPCSTIWGELTTTAPPHTHCPQPPPSPASVNSCHSGDFGIECGILRPRRWCLGKGRRNLKSCVWGITVSRLCWLRRERANPHKRRGEKPDIQREAPVAPDDCSLVPASLVGSAAFLTLRMMGYHCTLIINSVSISHIFFLKLAQVGF